MNNTYFKVYDFMVDELHLSQNQLLIYALIFGFCVGAENGCTASQAYIAKRTGIRRETVNRCLKALCKKGLIEETSEGKTQRYLLKELTGNGKKCHRELLKKRTEPCYETSHNKKNYNKVYMKSYIGRGQINNKPSFNLSKAERFCY